MRVFLAFLFFLCSSSAFSMKKEVEMSKYEISYLLCVADCFCSAIKEEKPSMFLGIDMSDDSSFYWSKRFHDFYKDVSIEKEKFFKSEKKDLARPFFVCGLIDALGRHIEKYHNENEVILNGELQHLHEKLEISNKLMCMFNTDRMTYNERLLLKCLSDFLRSIFMGKTRSYKIKEVEFKEPSSFDWKKCFEELECNVSSIDLKQRKIFLSDVAVCFCEYMKKKSHAFGIRLRKELKKLLEELLDYCVFLNKGLE